MRSFSPVSGRPGSAVRSMALATVVVGGLVLLAPSAVRAEDAPVSQTPATATPRNNLYVPTFGNCAGDFCDGYAWAAARGADNSGSYWNMSPGHNCTNYVAWKLIQGGVEKPLTHPGNATTWADRARADGFLVDNVPEVGAVAHWYGGTNGYSADGHVAYVEQLNPDGTIVVSEDYWFGGSQTGPLTFKVIDPASVGNFIHYGAKPVVVPTLRVTDPISGQWVTTDTGLTTEVTSLAALQIDGTLEMLVVEDGMLRSAANDGTSWQLSDTGFAVEGESLSAVDMGNGRPYVMTVKGGELVMIVRTSVGWQYMPTGIAAEDNIAAVNLAGLWPTVYSVENGVLQETFGGTLGWEKKTTMIGASGPITASVNQYGWPEVFWVEEGVIRRAWADQIGWQSESLGITTDGELSATTVAGAVQVVVSEGSEIAVVKRDSSGAWVKGGIGIPTGAEIATLGTPEGPRVIQIN